MEIKNIELGSEAASELNALLNKEWPDVGVFETVKHGVTIPKPIVAIENNTVIGGLSFTCYKAPDCEQTAVWVNTVFVIPNFRHQGIATKLIEASQKSGNCLYALTNIPVLYTKIGWQAVNISSSGTIVKYAKNT